MSDEKKPQACPDCGGPAHRFWWDCPKLKSTYKFQMSPRVPGTLKQK